MVTRPEHEEEAEVLQSIFEGDDAFKQVTETEFQYKIGEDGTMKSFLLTIKWPEDYPECKPDISLDSFYNKHLLAEVKEQIISSANEQADAMVGDAATYTIIDWAKENTDLLLTSQPTSVTKPVEQSMEAPVAKKKEKKEQLTKAQKRKQADRVGECSSAFS